MIAIDANVVVRVLVNDDVSQASRARSLMACGQQIFVSPTVLLESEWVLRSAYGFDAARIAVYLRSMLGLPCVHTAEPEHVARALAGYEQGMDLADALHLALSHEAESFYTFDKVFRRKAHRAMPGLAVNMP